MSSRVWHGKVGPIWRRRTLKIPPHRRQIGPDEDMTMPLNIAHDALYMIEYRDSQAVLVLADGEAAAERGRRAAEQARCRVSATVGIEEDVDRQERENTGQGKRVSVRGEHGGGRILKQKQKT